MEKVKGQEKELIKEKAFEQIGKYSPKARGNLWEMAKE
jgi:hypothetical protein